MNTVIRYTEQDGTMVEETIPHEPLTLSHKIAQGWRAYAERNDLRVGTQKYWKAQHAFINGCNVLSGEEGLPPIIQIYVMTGRDIAELREPVEA
jgi:hypothetical protein